MYLSTVNECKEFVRNIVHEDMKSSECALSEVAEEDGKIGSVYRK